MAETERPLLGAGMFVLANAVFALAGLFVQFASTQVSSWTTVFSGFLFGGIFIIPFVLIRRRGSSFASPNLALLVVRGIVSVAQIGMLFKAVASISLLETMLFRETAPFWIPLLSSIFLGEAMPRRIWPVLLCGFVGVALVLHPNIATLNAGYLYGLAAGLLFAVQVLLTRRLNKLGEPQDRILLYIFAIGILGTFIPAAQTYVTPDYTTIVQLFIAGLFLIISTTLLVFSTAHAPAWLIAPLGYSAVVFSALIDWLVLDKVPNLVSSVGMLLVIVSGVLTLRFASYRNRIEPVMTAKERSS
ncbi:DMT family transporter [Hoeflea sp. WL0058]|uniref:DMT family transporter n=1 Tax=Flavimaribacter sediminis TaxID=2865987 RepID=A0AAE3D0P4_9HYPH|nr:DMT family transporter [Flavimaribacter sediminis]MBW8636908.1 DMT family transporter [Flavimaribacter sediminis]